MSSPYIKRITRPLLLLLFLGICAGGAKAGTGGGPRVAGTILGGSERDHITASTVLPNGDIAVCGWSDSRNIVEQLPGFQSQPVGGVDAFLAVLNPALDTIRAFTFFGGIQDDRATAVAYDGHGRIIIVGETMSPNLPMSIGSYKQLFMNEVDGFVAAFSLDLRTLDRATYIPGAEDEHPLSATVDGNGSIYDCGWTTSAVGFPTNNGYDRSYSGGRDAFVCKLDRSLSTMQFSSYFGGENDDMFTAVHLTRDGAIALTGSTSSASFETFPKVDPYLWWVQKDRPYDWTYNGGLSDAILTVLTIDGGQLLVSTFFGGNGEECGRAVFSDGQGKLIIIGESTSTDLPSAGGGQVVPKGEADVMIGVFANRGRVLAASRLAGGGRADSVRCAVAMADDVWMIGATSSSIDLTAVGAGTTSEVRGGKDVLLMKLSATSTEFTTYLGGSGADDVAALVLDANKDVIVVGSTTSPTLDLDGQTLTARGQIDGYAVRWAFGSLNLTAPRGGERLCVGQTITFNWNVDEMPSTEPFDVERSADGIRWTTIATNVRGRSFVWSPDAEAATDTTMYVRVRTRRGHASVSADVVRVDPRVTAEPLPKTITACRDRSISVPVVTRGADVRYQWRRNGVLTPRTTSVLVLERFDPEADAGVWECVVTGGCGQIVVVGPMTVQRAQSLAILRQPAATTVIEGGTANLTVEAEGARSYEWTREGSADVLGTSATLQFTAVRLEQAGRYRCRIVGECDTMDTDVAELVVTPTGVDDVLQRVHIAIWPQPANDELHIQTTGTITRVELCDVDGRAITVRQSSIPGSATVVDLTPVPAGVYVLVMQEDTGETHRRLVVVR